MPDQANFSFAQWPLTERKGALAESFVQGVRHGPTLAFYVDGQKASQGDFVNGKESGLWTFWHKDGSIAAQLYFTDGAVVPVAYQQQHQQRQAA